MWENCIFEQVYFNVLNTFFDSYMRNKLDNQVHSNRTRGIWIYVFKKSKFKLVKNTVKEMASAWSHSLRILLPSLQKPALLQETFFISSCAEKVAKSWTEKFEAASFLALR